MTGRHVAALAVSALALGAAALYQGPMVRRYKLRTNRLARGSRLRLAVAADLHGQVFGVRQGELLALLQGQRPDCILLPGDILDERRDPRPAWDFLRGAAHVAPTYYCPGNHEYRTSRIRRILAKAESCGVTVLPDRFTRLQTSGGPLLIAGCEDAERAVYADPSYRQEEALPAAFSGMAGEPGFRILMAHRPEKVRLYRELGFDLVVSGHTHGGQARIPFLLNGLIAPGQGFFPPLAGGLYDHGSFRQLVSRGLAGYPPLPRVFNPPEIAVLDIVGVGARQGKGCADVQGGRGGSRRYS